MGEIAAAEAVLIGAPVYRASYPGVLKNLLDTTPVEALQAKPVGIVAMGGSPHHYLGVDWQLREVLTWFGALVAPTSVYITGGDFKDGSSRPKARARRSGGAGRRPDDTGKARDKASPGPIPLAARYT